VGACFFHCALALIGIFYRYEAYLMVLFLTVAVLCLREILAYSGPSSDSVVSKRDWLLSIGGVTLLQIALSPILWIYQLNANLIVSIYAVGIITLGAMERGARTRGRLFRTLVGTTVPLALYFMIRGRAVQSALDIPTASEDIYLQQFQMSRFVNRYYRSGRLVANDIGAVTYFSNVHLLDLWGLASDPIRDLKLTDNWNTKTMKQQIDAFGPDLVIAYPDWYQKNRAMPSSVLAVATWTIPHVTSAAHRTVQFYAPPNRIPLLRQELKEFEKELPPEVTVAYATN
jgi:hypothetical protein